MPRTTKRMSRACGAFLLSLPLAAAAAAPDAAPPRWRLVPQVDVSAAYDSNIYRTSSDEKEDGFVEPELSLRYLSSTETNLWHVRALAFASARRHAREEGKDFESFGEEAEVSYGGERETRVSFFQDFRRVEDIDRHLPGGLFGRRTGDLMEDINSQSAQRDILDAGASCDVQASDKTDVLLGYQFTRLDYDSPDLLDLYSHLLQAEAAHQLTDVSALYADLRYGAQDQVHGPASADVVKARIGLRTWRTDTLVARAGLGAQYYERTGASDESSDTSASADLGLSWQATDKVGMFAGFNNGSQLSSFYQDNALDYVSGWMGVSYRWTLNTTATLRGQYRRDDYLDPVTSGGETKDRRDERVLAVARIDYLAPSRDWGAYLEGMAEDVTSTIEGAEYDVRRLTLGSHVAF